MAFAIIFVLFLACALVAIHFAVGLIALAMKAAVAVLVVVGVVTVGRLAFKK